jgi:hypothetical protein
MAGIQFNVTSFSNPTTGAYQVQYNHRAGRKHQILDCTCPYFKRFGSACNHMYCLGRVNSMIVVELPMQASKAVAAQPATSSDTNNLHEGQSSSTGVTGASPGACVEAGNLLDQYELISWKWMLYPKPRKQQHAGANLETDKLPTAPPVLQSSGLQGERDLTTDLPDPLFFLPTPTRSSNQPTKSELERLAANKRSKESGRLGLKKAIKILKRIQNVQDFIARASPDTIQEFMVSTRSILMMVEDPSPNQPATPFNQVPLASDRF